MSKYCSLNESVSFGFLVNAMQGGGDKGKSYPRSDAEDMSRGLRFIPGEVTMARRRGERVDFIQSCRNKCCWYWQFQDGSRTYYWERGDYEHIAFVNGVELETNEYGSKVGITGNCPDCGNSNTKGGHIKPEDI